MESKPLFLTHKIKIQPLNLKLYDSHIIDHLKISTNIYTVQCSCRHSHNKEKCNFRTTSSCVTCKCVNLLTISYKSLLFHSLANTLYKCDYCTHKHDAPCNNCIKCKINEPCIILESFDCNLSNFNVCEYCGKFTKLFQNSKMLSKHQYNIPKHICYICEKHEHYHKNNPNKCPIQQLKCCDEAIELLKYPGSFFVYVNELGKTNPTKYIFCDPKFWREQSINHFISWLLAVCSEYIENNNCKRKRNDYKKQYDLIKNRYEKFTTSSFKIPDLSTYKSGRDSIVRTDITGYTTKGLYQTSIISSIIPQNEIILPQKLYDLCEIDCFMEFGIVKRDPSFRQTCTFLFKLVRNVDPTINTLIIPGMTSKPYNQDQDGDKNAIYLFLKQIIKGYDRKDTFLYKMCQLEFKVVSNYKQTLLAEPRYLFSEHDMILLHRFGDQLFADDEFYMRTKKHGFKFMAEASCGYLKNEFKLFEQKLIEENKKERKNIITIFDIKQKTNTLNSIYESGAKTNRMTLKLLNDNLYSPKKLNESLDELLTQMNRYILSSKKLRFDGHSEFILLTSLLDIIVNVYIVFWNKKILCDLKPYSNLYCLNFDEASLDLCLEDLECNYLKELNK